MFHKVSYEWFRVTQYIPELGLFYKKVGILLGRTSGSYSQGNDGGWF